MQTEKCPCIQQQHSVAVFLVLSNARYCQCALLEGHVDQLESVEEEMVQYKLSRVTKFPCISVLWHVEKQVNHDQVPSETSSGDDTAEMHFGQPDQRRI